MIADVPLFLLSFVIILAGSELFVNGIEWFGRRLRLGEGAVGSVLAAVGTALPETIIPIIAIFVRGGSAETDVATGAILGAPFMLSTLAMFVCGLSVVVYAARGRRTLTIRINRKVLARDLSFFCVLYLVAVLLGVLDLGRLRQLGAAGLFLAYGLYVYQTVRSEGDLSGDARALYFHRAQESPQMRRILLQVFVALVAIIVGADLFITEITRLAEFLGVPALYISLLLTPIATELPEKFNSVSWMRQRKDALALGNITGAMVFQSAVPVAMGVAFTAWRLTGEGLLTAVLALASGCVLLLQVRWRGKVHVASLLAGGGFYAVFLIATLVRIVR